MDFLRDQFFAGAGVAADENGTMGRSHLFNLVQNSFDPRAAADNLSMRVAGFKFGPEILAFFEEAVFKLFDFLLQCVTGAVELDVFVERLGEQPLRWQR